MLTQEEQLKLLQEEEKSERSEKFTQVLQKDLMFTQELHFLKLM
jgi:hypothetical protein